MSADPERVHSPWLAVSGVCGVYFAFGLTIGVMAPLVGEISRDLSLSRGTMGSILGAWAMIYVFTAVPAGAFVDRVGLRWSLTIGGAAIVASALLRSLASGAPTLFAAVAVFGIGGPLVSIATPKLIASLFEADERRLPTGLAVAAPSLGTAVGLAVTNPVLLPLADGSWRGVLVVVGVVAGGATTVWLFTSRAVPPVAPEATRTDRVTLLRLLRLASVRRVLAICVFSFFFSHALNAWLPEILSDSGRSDDAAGYLAAVSVTFGLAGSLLVARLVPNDQRPTALVIIFVTLAAAVVAIGSVPLALLIPSLGLIGVARAGVIPLLFLEIMGDPEISVSDLGAVTGLFFAIGEIGGFSGPYVVGFVADRTDGFDTATAVLAAVALGAAAGAISLRRARHAVAISARTPARRLRTP